MTRLYVFFICIIFLPVLFTLIVVFVQLRDDGRRAAGQENIRSVQEPAEKNKAPVIGFANMADSLEFCINIKNILIHMAKEKGWSVITLDNNLDGMRALHNVESLIQKKVDYIIMFNADLSTQGVIAEKIKASGIPAIALNFPLDGYPVLGVDEENAGKLCRNFLGDYAKNTWKQEPDLFIILDGSPAMTYMQVRSEACEEGFKSDFPGYPQEKTVHITATEDILAMKAKLAYALAIRPDARRIGIAGASDSLCADALAILQAMHRDNEAVMCSLGADTIFMKQLTASKGQSAWKAAVSFTPELYGKILIPLIEHELSGKPVPRISRINPALIDRSTISEYYPEFTW